MKKLLLLLLVSSILVLSACGSSTEEGTVETAGQHELTITATSDGWDAPEQVAAGWTDITLVNQSDGMRQAAFLRLDDDKTMDDVFAAIEAGMQGTPEWMTAYGGVSGVFPGVTRSVSAELPAGQYIVIDPVPEADGVPGMAKGYFMPLLVEESDVATAAPTSDLTINMVDYAYDFDGAQFVAGSHKIQVTNSGQQEDHELVVVKLNDGATVEDFLMATEPGADAGPPPGEIVAGTAAFDSATENYMDVEFEADATYAFICFLPSTEQAGAPHFTLGMVSQFETP